MNASKTMQKLNSLRLAALALGALVLGTSCSSLDYGDSNAVETVTIGYGSTDLQTLSAEMVDSLLMSTGLSYLKVPEDRGDPRVIVVFGGIQNRTDEHIDTGGIADKIQVRLLSSGKFRWVVSSQGRSEVADEVRYQQGSGFVDPNQAAAMGRQNAADIVIYGSLRSIVKKRGSSIESGGTRTKDVFYQFVLNAVNVETGEILWAEEAELRKTERTGIFGR
ncbi:MAG: hypothetical protein ACI8QS_001919 [Planctomycetota bacterium]|jgi:uncharacterized protein (TIGR02722 family)